MLHSKECMRKSELASAFSRGSRVGQELCHELFRLSAQRRLPFFRTPVQRLFPDFCMTSNKDVEGVNGSHKFWRGVFIGFAIVCVFYMLVAVALWIGLRQLDGAPPPSSIR